MPKIGHLPLTLIVNLTRVVVCLETSLQAFFEHLGLVSILSLQCLGRHSNILV